MADPHQIQVVHGPNLNLLGTREPEIYGRTSLDEINAELASRRQGVREAEVEFFQSNHEGALIDRIQEAISWADGILINPGGLTHTSVSLRDALARRGFPSSKSTSPTSSRARSSAVTPWCRDIAVGVVSGFGPRATGSGLQALIDHLASG